MKLPCRDILSVRKLLGLSLFSLQLCSRRWQMDYFTSNHRAYASSSHSDEADLSGCVTIDVNKVSEQISCVKTEQEKYAKAFKVVQAMAQHLSHMGMEDFEFNLTTLKLASQARAQGKRFSVIEFEEGVF